MSACNYSLEGVLTTLKILESETEFKSNSKPVRIFFIGTTKHNSTSKIIFLDCCQPALILSVREVRLDIRYALMFIFLKVTAVQSKDVTRV